MGYLPIAGRILHRTSQLHRPKPHFSSAKFRAEEVRAEEAGDRKTFLEAIEIGRYLLDNRKDLRAQSSGPGDFIAAIGTLSVPTKLLVRKCPLRLLKMREQPSFMDLTAFRCKVLLGGSLDSMK